MLKNLLFAVLCLVLSHGVTAQQQDIRLAKSELVKQSEKYGLDREEISNFIVSDHYVTKHNNASHLYLWQTHNAIPVYNGIITFGIKNNKIYNIASNAVADLASKIGESTLTLSPDKAIQAAGNKLGFPNNETFTRLEEKSSNSFVYASTSFASNNIPVFLCYEITTDGRYVLAWNVDLDIPGSDYWSVRIDAETGDIITKNNYTLYCKFDHDASHAHDNICKSNFGVNESVNKNETNQALVTNMMMDATYRVYPAPAESPNHGTHDLLVNPADAVASPFGWHDTDGVDGAEFTITRGNNVYSYLDKDDNNQSDGGEPDGGESLIFDFPHNTLADPDGSLNAAQVNLFYMNNFLHDFFYRHGFDEASGNFQENNYGNGGQGGDFVRAESNDGAAIHYSDPTGDSASDTPHIDNANFSTPGDGGNGRMQMYVWNTSPFGILQVSSPAELEGTYEARAAAFGANITTESVIGDLEIVMDASDQPLEGCETLINDLTGKIALIDRGTCEFGVKALNAQEAGAIGAIVCNIAGVNGGNGSEIIQMGGGVVGLQVDIPVMMATLQDCNQFKASINAGVPVSVTIQSPPDGPSYWDGSFDNGVVAHEFGHGISNRLTGGPQQAGCLNTWEQMGEGWSDYLALVTSVEPGDLGDDARGIGTYVSSQSTAGSGIRTQRYSTDFSENTKTFDDIIGQIIIDADTQIERPNVHAIGEVWAAMIWDLYWAMVDKYGYDADVTNQESGNAKAIRLVLDGMREQGCSPGYEQGRDGIIAADIANNEGENICLIWDVFARRGLGVNALTNSVNDLADGVQDFTPLATCIEELKIKKRVTEIVMQNEEIDVTLDIVNHIKNTVTGVVVTDEIPEGTTFIDGSASLVPTIVGNLLTWEIGDLEYEEALQITYKLHADEGTSSTTFIFDDLEDGDDNWDVSFYDDYFHAFWELTDVAANTGDNAFYMENVDTVSDSGLEYFNFFEVQGENPALLFKHLYNTEKGSDGGFISVQEEGQVGWTRLNSDHNILNGYDITLAYGTFALGNLSSFSGTTNDEFITTIMDLSDFVGKNIRIQFRFGTDANTAPDGDLKGWVIDDFEIIDLKKLVGEACITDDQSNSNCSLAQTIIESNGTVAIDETEVDDYGMTLFPNPTSDIVNIRFTATESEQAVLSIYAVDGTVVASQNIALKQGEEFVKLPVSNLAKGFYVVQLQGEKNTSIKRLIVD